MLNIELVPCQERPEVCEYSSEIQNLRLILDKSIRGWGILITYVRGVGDRSERPNRPAFKLYHPAVGPGPGWGPYGPIWALMLVLKSEAFRVQTAPFDKIRTDLWRSPEASTHPRPAQSQKLERQIIIS